MNNRPMLHQSQKRASRRSRKGGALIEMALTLGILMTLSFGAIEFAYAFFVKHALTNAATQGGWAAVVPSASNSEVQAAVDAQMSASKLSSSGYTVTTSPSDISSVPAGSMVIVQVSCIWGTAGRGFRPLGLLGAGKTLSASCAMRKEPG